MKMLLKHDFLQTKKKFFTLFIVTLAISILAPLLIWLEILSVNNNNFAASAILSFLSTIVFGGFIAISVLVLTTAYKYIKDSLFTKQGYLTFTLPYKTSQIVLSKIITIVAWSVCYILVVILGLSIILGEGFLIITHYVPLEEIKAEFQSINFSEIREVFDTLYLAMNNNNPSLVVWSRILIVLNIIAALPTYLILFFIAGSLVNTNIIKSIKKNPVVLIFFLLIFGVHFITQIIQVSVRGTTLFIIPLIVQLIIDLAIDIGGYQLTVYLLEHRLELV